MLQQHAGLISIDKTQNNTVVHVALHCGLPAAHSFHPDKDRTTLSANNGSAANWLFEHAKMGQLSHSNVNLHSRIKNMGFDCAVRVACPVMMLPQQLAQSDQLPSARASHPSGTTKPAALLCKAITCTSATRGQPSLSMSHAATGPSGLSKLGYQLAWPCTFDVLSQAPSASAVRLRRCCWHCL